MNFIQKKRILLNNLSDNASQPVFTATLPTTVYSIILCNRSKTNMRINLEQATSLVDPIEIPLEQAFILENVLIETNVSVNLVNLIKAEGSNSNNDLFLKPDDRLLCFSNGVSEKFDCSIYYYEETDLNTLI